MAEVACCFPRRDSRLLARQMTQAMLMELERRNCWTLAEALGHPGPHRLQHFLSRGSWDHDAARDRLARWGLQVNSPRVKRCWPSTRGETRSPPPTAWARPASTPGPWAGWDCARSPSTSPTPRRAATR
ncbi:transposase [Streptomyces sp. NPDC057908]|uniref:transposase n=1 Tax=Streptomyces sp. NPDC057908 TaxID=3346276 RepID=UPI0036E721A9